MKTRLVFACVLVLSAAAFAQVPVQPAGASASSALSFQSSGQNMRFQVKDSKQFIRLAILDMQGRSVWSRVMAPADGTISISWEGMGMGGSRTASGIYTFRATTAESRSEKVLMTRRFAYTP